jgi:uncharacterized protein (TIRG00374 family)
MKKKKNKSVLNILLLIGMTILVLYFVMRDNFDNIMYQLSQANLWWIALATVLFYLGLYLKSISFVNIVHEFNPKFSLFETVRLQLATQFFNGVTPFATGGQPFVIVWLNKKGVDTPSSMNIVVQDFITYQTGLVILGIYAVLYNFFFHMFPANSVLKNLVTIGFLMNTLVIILLYVVTLNPKFNKKLTGWIVKFLDKVKLVKDKDKTIKQWEDYVDRFSSGANALFHNKKLFIKSIILNMLYLTSQYLVPLAIAYALGIHSFGINECLIASAYSMLIGAFVPIPGSTGGLEYAFLQFFGNFVKDGALLSALMILWRAITYYFAMLVGAIALYVKKDESK